MTTDDGEAADPTVRWDALADDLASQAAAVEAAERRAIVDEVTRAELAETTLLERVRSTFGHEVRVDVRGSAAVRGVVTDVGEGWLVVVGPHGEYLVPLVALLSMTGAGTRSAHLAESRSTVRSRSFGHQLRQRSRDRSTVHVVLQSGQIFVGTMDVVGADYVELAEHHAGELQRANATDRVVIPLAAIGIVRSVPPSSVI